MKKFRFLIFTLILTSMFIGCAQPTDDPVIPEVPKTVTEEETVSDIYSDWVKEVEAKFNLNGVTISNDGSGDTQFQFDLAKYKVSLKCGVVSGLKTILYLGSSTKYNILESQDGYTFSIMVYNTPTNASFIEKPQGTITLDDVKAIISNKDIFNISLKETK